MTVFQPAERVADAVLYEGYVLYPYRASSAKNRVRWQFGAVMPPAYVEHDDSERSAVTAECLVADAASNATIQVRLRFLRINSRAIEAASTGGGYEPVESLEVGGETFLAWDEGLPHAIDIPSTTIADLLVSECSIPVFLPDMRSGDVVRDESGEIRGRVRRHARRLTGTLWLAATRIDDFVRVRLSLANHTPWPDDVPFDRSESVRHAFLGAHLLAFVSGARFLSLTDPPEEAVPAVAACRQQGLWPALIGTRENSLVLCSPIILGDYPGVAPESPGDLCDATEIDEILTLRIQTLTDEEKREARATDPRAREIVDRSDSLSPGAFARLHGTRRDDQTAMEALLNPQEEAPPERAAVDVQGVRVTRGSHVRLQPMRRADPMDMFLIGRNATVAAVYRDVEDRAYVAVTIDDDPGADLHDGLGRYFYFYPDEIVPQTEVRS